MNLSSHVSLRSPSAGLAAGEAARLWEKHRRVRRLRGHASVGEEWGGRRLKVEKDFLRRQRNGHWKMNEREKQTGGSSGCLSCGNYSDLITVFQCEISLSFLSSTLNSLYIFTVNTMLSPVTLTHTPLCGPVGLIQLKGLHFLCGVNRLSSSVFNQIRWSWRFQSLQTTTHIRGQATCILENCSSPPNTKITLLIISELKLTDLQVEWVRFTLWVFSLKPVWTNKVAHGLVRGFLCSALQRRRRSLQCPSAGFPSWSGDLNCQLQHLQMSPVECKVN